MYKCGKHARENKISLKKLALIGIILTLPIMVDSGKMTFAELVQTIINLVSLDIMFRKM